MHIELSVLEDIDQRNLKIWQHNKHSGTNTARCLGLHTILEVVSTFSFEEKTLLCILFHSCILQSLITYSLYLPRSCRIWDIIFIDKIWDANWQYFLKILFENLNISLIFFICVKCIGNTKYSIWINKQQISVTWTASCDNKVKKKNQHQQHKIKKLGHDWNCYWFTSNLNR